jgi:hypothetical protein
MQPTSTLFGDFNDDDDDDGDVLVAPRATPVRSPDLLPVPELLDWSSAPLTDEKNLLLPPSRKPVPSLHLTATMEEEMWATESSAEPRPGLDTHRQPLEKQPQSRSGVRQQLDDRSAVWRMIFDLVSLEKDELSGHEGGHHHPVEADVAAAGVASWGGGGGGSKGGGGSAEVNLLGVIQEALANDPTLGKMLEADLGKAYNLNCLYGLYSRSFWPVNHFSV